jgi:hypothetical protein
MFSLSEHFDTNIIGMQWLCVWSPKWVWFNLMLFAHFHYGWLMWTSADRIGNSKLISWAFFLQHQCKELRERLLTFFHDIGAPNRYIAVKIPYFIYDNITHQIKRTLNISANLSLTKCYTLITMVFWMLNISMVELITFIRILRNK